MDDAIDPPHAKRRLLLRLAGFAALSAPAGCAPVARRQAVPRGQVADATVLGLPNERFLIPRDLPALAREYDAAFERRTRYHADVQPPYEMLGVSGGGEDGAFGAGLLNGWTRHGNRPRFDLVTGVSTGALTAPFAFLGSGWDGGLREIYTQTPAEELIRSRGYLAALTDDALSDNAPMRRTIARRFDGQMMEGIAEGYRQGRLLLVGTANLDAQLPVTWNLGAIAASGHPDALALLRHVLLAAAAIPGAFPPVMLEVTAGGRRYEEMHVDGGAFSQVFLYPRRLTELRRQRLGHAMAANAYVIRNGRFDPDWAEVDRSTLTIAARAIATMIGSAGYNDVVRLWTTAERDGVDFNLAYIGHDFDTPYTEPFDQTYMRALYAYGFDRAQQGYPWAKRPPG